MNVKSAGGDGKSRKRSFFIDWSAISMVAPVYFASNATGSFCKNGFKQ